jgi:hypothetical protein
MRDEKKTRNSGVTFGNIGGADFAAGWEDDLMKGNQVPARKWRKTAPLPVVVKPPPEEKAVPSNLTPREFLRLYTEQCPCYSKALASCPLSDLRLGSDAVEIGKKLAAMSDEEARRLYELHLECLAMVCGSET